jgi:hypothetical protein
VTAPRFNILTQKELTIDLSRPAMLFIIEAVGGCGNIYIENVKWTSDVQCELDNFVNTLHNLLERSEPKTGNLDLIGE